MMPATSLRTLLFDMDGTLVDNFHALHQAFSHAHEALGLTPPSYEKVVRTVGGSAPVTLAKLMGEAKAREALPIFERFFEAHMFEGLTALPGAAWLLEHLKARGLQLAVFTNKSGEVARAMCEALGLEHYLEAIIGADDTPWRKPQAAFTRHALDILGARAETTGLIGDSIYDVQAAHAGGLRAWVVATGTHEAAELEACEPAPERVFADLYALGEGLFGLQRPCPS